jgi:hypothetical protein
VGDFNADPDKYLHSFEQGRAPEPHFTLTAFLFSNDFVDSFSRDALDRPFATFYQRQSIPTSRIDQIWFSESLNSDDFCFNRVWQPPSACLSTSSRYQLDHVSVILYFTKSLFIGDLPLHKAKKQPSRTFFDVKNTSQEQWTAFTQHIDAAILDYDIFLPFPSKSTLPYEKKLLNRKWTAIRSAIQDTAKKFLPVKVITNKTFEQECSTPELSKIRSQLRSLNTIFAFLNSFCFNPNSFTSFQQALYMWRSKDSPNSLYNLLGSINQDHKKLIDPSTIPFELPCFGHSSTKSLHKHVAALRNTLRLIRDSLESKEKRQRIEFFESLRCENFATLKSAFIASALSRSKRSIVLDRAMHTDANNNTTLITEPTALKKVVADHFKFIAGNPPSVSMTFDLLPDNWKPIYTPPDDIDDNIYNSILFPVTEEEWNSALSSLPSGKAAGLSGIPYEMLKHLSPDASSYLKDLVSLCFSTSYIPSEWKDATIYPIPKPHEWNCYLSNTRPITLLDTTRKLMTKIMYKRLSSVLSEHNVLKGGNFAGLPGGNCDTPIALMNMLLRDSSANNKPLFILQQVISKAFDSIDTNMLRLSMQRLKIPDAFISLTLELFTNRSNTVITSFGPTANYKMHVGIDQGETISPLLWVIYIDPLLTKLNACNPLLTLLIRTLQLIQSPCLPLVTWMTRI